jgi:hypothetical protein
MLTNLVVTKTFFYLCTMKKDIIKIIIKGERKTTEIRIKVEKVK